MDVRPRFFLKTKDNLFFAVNTYHHPKSHFIAFLRYMPHKDGDRNLNGIKYKKVNSQEAYDFVRELHPEYLFEWNVEGKMMMGVLKEDVVEVLSPIDKLNEIIKSDDENVMYEKIRILSSIFHKKANIDYENMGVTGSVLAGLNNCSTSDIDFVVFGVDNHKKAMKLFSDLKNDKNSPIEKISGDYWKAVYDNRIKDNSMSLSEFAWYESRKNNRGLIRGTTFALLLTRNTDEILEEDVVVSKALGKCVVKCEISDDSRAYDIPSTFRVKNVEVLDGVNKNIESILSFTHTYTGIVKNNERIIASGVCEEVTKKGSNKTYNLIVGTTRESINEYIKLEKNPLKKK